MSETTRDKVKASIDTHLTKMISEVGGSYIDTMRSILAEIDSPRGKVQIQLMVTRDDDEML